MAAVAKKAASAADKGSVLRVTAPLVQLQLGEQVLHLRNGDIVPEGASDEWIQHHTDLGFVTKGDAPTKPEDDK